MIVFNGLPCGSQSLACCGIRGSGNCSHGSVLRSNPQRRPAAAANKAWASFRNGVQLSGLTIVGHLPYKGCTSTDNDLVWYKYLYVRTNKIKIEGKRVIKLMTDRYDSKRGLQRDSYINLNTNYTGFFPPIIPKDNIVLFI